MVRLLLPRRPVWLAPAVLALAACSSTGPGVSPPVSLSVTTRSPAAAPTSSPASAAITVGSGANSVTLTKVQVVLARIELAMNQEVWVRVPLQIGAVIQAIDVNEPFIPVDRDTPALHTFIDERAITELPLDGRNFLELALLAPGTVPPPQGSASSARGDFALSINGAIDRSARASYRRELANKSGHHWRTAFDADRREARIGEVGHEGRERFSERDA